MWAGHASLVIMNVFKNLESLVSYDPSEVSERNARQIKKYYPQHTFHKEAIWGNEHRHTDIDLIFVELIKQVLNCIQKLSNIIR
mgnify:CR=1 FL=1